jgi:orotidine-5'-phosphate decarboxylase
VSTVPILALDVSDREAALALVDELGETCRFYKVGAELFTAVGPQIVAEIRDRNADVFLDLKFHDIPNTVAGAVRNAARLGVRLLTVHAAGGGAMLAAAAKAAADAEHLDVFAVTVLTSLDAAAIGDVWGRSERMDLSVEVGRLAAVAHAAGLTGVVCSGHEAAAIKGRFGPKLGVLIPGVRLPGGAAHDQSRVVTPREAAAAGADYVVVGRAVTGASDRRAAMREICGQLQ